MCGLRIVYDFSKRFVDKVSRFNEFPYYGSPTVFGKNTMSQQQKKRALIWLNKKGTRNFKG